VDKKYRVGVIGHTGRGDYGHGLDTVWLSMPQCEIVGVADADPGGLKKTVKKLNAPAGFSDYRKLLEKARPDIVGIGPRWLDQHRDMVLAAAERGVHMYMEKPFCRNLEEADQMVAACEQSGAKLAIAHQTRYSPKLQAVRQLIEDGRIGDVLELRGRGKEDHRGGGEDLWVLGSHIMNLMHYLAGEPRWCFASVLQQGLPVTGEHVQPGKEEIGPLAGDMVHAMYGMDHGITAYFGSHRNAGASARFGLQVYGSKGVVEILTGYMPSVFFLDDATWSPGRGDSRWIPVSSAGIGQPEPLTDVHHGAGNVAACKDLIAAIEQDRQPECHPYEGRMTVEMIAAVFESHRQGEPVKIPLETRRNPLTLL